MGYDVDTLLELTFPDRDGAVVTVREIDLDTMLALMGMREAAGGRSNVQWVEDGLGWLAKSLDSWNLERKGEPLPPTEASLRSIGFHFGMQILNAWMDSQVAVPAPLDSPSSSGAPVQAALPTMEVL